MEYESNVRLSFALLTFLLKILPPLKRRWNFQHNLYTHLDNVEPVVIYCTVDNKVACHTKRPADTSSVHRHFQHTTDRHAIDDATTVLCNQTFVWAIWWYELRSCVLPASETRLQCRGLCVGQHSPAERQRTFLAVNEWHTHLWKGEYFEQILWQYQLLIGRKIQHQTN